MKENSKDLNIILLGAGKPEEGLKHTALSEVDKDSRLLDWLLQCFPKDVRKIQFVGGYKMNEIARKYPELDFVENKNWQKTGAAGSLFKAVIPECGKLLISYSDILYREGIVKRLLEKNSDVVVAIDSLWEERFWGRTEEGIFACEKVYFSDEKVTRLGPDINRSLANGEFIGLVCLNVKALQKIKSISEETGAKLAKTNLSELIEWLRLEGLSLTAVDVKGDWAELDDPKDLAHFVLGTKAQTLDRLQRLVTKSRIEDQLAFLVADWKSDRDLILKKIQKVFGDTLLIIRSSALSEDGFSTANAGAFQSILNVPGNDTVILAEAIRKVIQSYGDSNPANEVLVQRMANDICISGVAFTRTLAYGAPYYIINFDDVSGSTESITSGNSNEHKTLVVRRDAPLNTDTIPEHLKKLIAAIKEIESLVEYDSLDIEFAINDKHEVVVFQVRPIAVDHTKWNIDDNSIYTLLKNSEEQFMRLQKESPFIKGKKAVFGIMPDWNPAEIIGTKPGRLASSLYSYLIMDDVWATQREEYGYKDVRPHPLLVTFAGHPYVDVRASFNSFVPASLDPKLTEKLVNFYIKQLCENPHFHDKVEFDIVPTCFAFDQDRWESILVKKGNLSLSEFKQLFNALKTITIKAFDRNKKDLDSIKILEKRFTQIKESNISELEKAWLLLEDCKRYGTLSFSHLARTAFVAITLLRSAVWKGIITKAEMDDYLSTITTVGNQITFDASDVVFGKLDMKLFISKYGHLRPGTYDITSEIYANDPEKYLAPMIKQSAKKVDKDVNKGKLWSNAKNRFYNALKNDGLPSDEQKVDSFLRSAIEGREYAKFVFSKNLSLALESIADFGNKTGLTREQLSHVSVEDILGIRKGCLYASKEKEFLEKRSDEGKKWREHTRAIELPPIISSSKDFYAFIYPSSQANYIGSGIVKATCINFAIKDFANNKYNIEGKIVIIPQADPGYDWLFGQKISGLITMYGGANSHMAIRAAEFGLPAAIGIGETEYRRIADAKILELNAGNRQINIIQK